MKDIKNYGGHYKVTRDGDVFSVRSNRFLKQNLKKNGYVYVELNLRGVAKTFRSHRLIAEAYIPNPEDKATVNHINGIKSDNRVDNLEWATVSENTTHAYAMGLLLPPTASEYMVVGEGESIKAYNYEELSEITGYGSSQITHYIMSQQGMKRGRYKNYRINKLS